MTWPYSLKPSSIPDKQAHAKNLRNNLTNVLKVLVTYFQLKCAIYLFTTGWAPFAVYHYVNCVWNVIAWCVWNTGEFILNSILWLFWFCIILLRFTWLVINTSAAATAWFAWLCHYLVWFYCYLLCFHCLYYVLKASLIFSTGRLLNSSHRKNRAKRDQNTTNTVARVSVNGLGSKEKLDNIAANTNFQFSVFLHDNFPDGIKSKKITISSNTTISELYHTVIALFSDSISADFYLSYCGVVLDSNTFAQSPVTDLGIGDNSNIWITHRLRGGVGEDGGARNIRKRVASSSGYEDDVSAFNGADNLFFGGGDEDNLQAENTETNALDETTFFDDDDPGSVSSDRFLSCS